MKLLLKYFVCALSIIGLIGLVCYFSSYEFRLKSKALIGDAQAQYTLGLEYFDGEPSVLGFSPQEGLEWLDKAARQGYQNAQLMLVEVYADLNGYYPQLYDETLALKWLKELEKAELEKATAFQVKKLLFHLYADGATFNKRSDLVKNWQMEVERKGSPEELQLLGEIYAKGRGLIEPNLEKSAALLQKAFDSGRNEAADALFQVLYQIEDYERAYQVAKTQLNNELTKGYYLYYVAMATFEGMGTEQNLTQAKQLFKQAIENHQDYRINYLAEDFVETDQPGKALFLYGLLCEVEHSANSEREKACKKLNALQK